MIDRLKNAGVWALILSIPGLLVLAVLWVNVSAFQEWRTHQRLAAQGVVVTGTLLRVDSIRSLKTGSSAHATYQYPSPQGGSSITVQREIDANLRTQLLRSGNGQALAIKHLPDDPQVSDISGNKGWESALLLAVVMDILFLALLSTLFWVARREQSVKEKRTS